MTKMKSKNILIMASVLLAVACAPLGKYKDETKVSEDLYGRGVELSDSSMARLGWKEVFTDPLLQMLIQTALDNNYDMKIAYEHIRQAEAALTGAKMGYVPNLSIAPAGGYSWSGVSGGSGAWNYNVAASFSWQLDIFTIEAKKKNAKATVEQTKDLYQATRVALIASVASGYYTLLMLDTELRTSEEMLEVWKKSVEAIHALKREGFADEVAVSQYEATYEKLCATAAKLRQQITVTENALSLMLGSTCTDLARSTLWMQSIPDRLEVGIPIQMLTYRPDVRASQRAVEAAFYSTKEAWLNFFPKLTIDGTAALTNVVSGAIVPMTFLGDLGASLVAPVLNRGLNKAKLRTAESKQREARLNLDYTLLLAGSEVNDAMASIKGNREKFVHYSAQIRSLVKARDDTELLMNNSQDKTYLDVLAAHNALIEAEFNGIETYANGLIGVVNLYSALGGGSEY